MAGFFRYKFENLPIGEHNITYTATNGTTYTKTVIVKPFCEGSIYLKYLSCDSGFYRFWMFDKKYEIKGSLKQIGTINKNFNNILTAQGKESNIGYTNTKTIEVASDSLTFDELTQVAKIYDSPRVYLKVNNTGNDLTDWILVTVKSKDNMYRRKKGNMYSIELTITLPETNTVTML